MQIQCCDGLESLPSLDDCRSLQSISLVDNCCLTSMLDSSLEKLTLLKRIYFFGNIEMRAKKVPTLPRVYKHLEFLQVCLCLSFEIFLTSNVTT
jgi:hypothetical protein